MFILSISSTTSLILWHRPSVCNKTTSINRNYATSKIATLNGTLITINSPSYIIIFSIIIACENFIQPTPSFVMLNIRLVSSNPYRIVNPIDPLNSQWLTKLLKYDCTTAAYIYFIGAFISLAFKCIIFIEHTQTMIAYMMTSAI